MTDPEERWPGLPRAAAPAEAARTSETAVDRLVRVAASTWACPDCGAIVARELAHKHVDWHGAWASGRRPARVVHGMSTPADPGVPFRILTLRSALPRERAVEALRGWVESQRADIGLRHPGGFRATLLGRTSWSAPAGPDSVPVRFAVDVDPDDAGSRLTVLLVAGATASVFAPASVRLDARFDIIEQAITDLLIRR